MKSVELLLLCLIWLCACISESCVLQEKDILLQFKHHIISTNQHFNEDGEFLPSWNNATHCCHDWERVKCDENSYHVRGLHLHDIGLETSTGEFLSPLSNLHSLTDLSLSNWHSLTDLSLRGNSLNISAVLVALANFSKLSYLDLGNNWYLSEGRDLQFQGWSDNSLAKLEHLDLSYNSLRGKLPPQLSKMSSLTVLDLGGNYLTSDFHYLSQLSSLQFLYMSGMNTSLTHEITVSVSTLRNLTELDLSGNSLNVSMLMSSVMKFNRLRHLSLQDNYADKQYGMLDLAEASVEALMSLEYLDLSSSIDMLENLDLSSNCPYGRLPVQFWSMSSLVHLDLGGTSLSFDAKSSERISALSSLKFLSLDGVNMNMTTKSFWQFSIANLSELEYLSVAGCSISHSLQHMTGLGKLTSLKDLRMDNNSLSGGLPSFLGNMSSLVDLDLSENSLSGGLPSFLGNMSSLVDLDLSENSLSGGLPSFIGNMSSLVRLDLAENMLDGEIKFSLPNLLVELDMFGNSLKGLITEGFFGNNTELSILYMGCHSLNMNLSAAWLPLFSLYELDMSNCKMNSNFPQWISTQANISRLNFSSCSLFGGLPPWFSELYGTLLIIDLSHNMLEGAFQYYGGAYTIDISYNNFTTLSLSPAIYPNSDVSLGPDMFLIARNNQLQGPLPSLHGLSIFAFDVANNRFSGTIPDSIVNSSTIEVLILENNNLSGKLPTSFGSQMVVMNLGKNRLSGTLPNSMSSCSHLAILEIGNNNFHGKFPRVVFQLSSLVVLQMSSNSFSGVIPKDIINLSLLRFLDLSNNAFAGSIPMIMMHSAYDTSDYETYSGKEINFHDFNSKGIFLDYIPDLDFNSKGIYLHYPILPLELEVIDLSGNSLTGNIPKYMANLTYLRQLNLSRNHLKGHIFPSITKMQALESLDLSSNQLTGMIPAGMERMSSLEVLNLSYNNFSGWIPRGGQMLTFGESSFYGNPNLRDTLPHIIIPAEPPQMSHSTEEEEEEDTQLWWEMVGLCYGIGFGSFYLAVSISRKFKKQICRIQDPIILWIFQR